MSVAPITCHILDTARGKPAGNVTCQIYYLSRLIASPEVESSYDLSADAKPFAMNKTDKDGRIKTWVLNPELTSKSGREVGINNEFKWEELRPGIYKMKFLTGKYFSELNESSRTFFPFVEIIFQIDNPPDNHYHIPLLLSNHSYTTYRGS